MVVAVVEVSAVGSEENNYIERYWRDATPADAIREPPMVARFLRGKSDWFIGKLHGCWRDFDDKLKWGDGTGLCSTTCQVYDAPDPGEGWRLIDTANEKWQEGDEIYEHSTGTWRKRLTPFQDLARSVNRRRIEQPKPKYVPFTWEDREQLRGRLITFVDRNRTVEFRCESFAVDDDGLIVNDAYADWLCKNAVFVDTKEPVGKRVQ